MRLSFAVHFGEIGVQVCARLLSQVLGKLRITGRLAPGSFVFGQQAKTSPCSMMSAQRPTQSSQMKLFGPAISFFTSCWDLPQNEQ